MTVFFIDCFIGVLWLHDLRGILRLNILLQVDAKLQVLFVPSSCSYGDLSSETTYGATFCGEFQVASTRRS